MSAPTLAAQRRTAAPIARAAALTVCWEVRALGTDLFAVTARVFYKKQGRAKYISHLDLVRCISRALKRSKLPVWHTLGFHPHVYLTF